MYTLEGAYMYVLCGLGWKLWIVTAKDLLPKNVYNSCMVYNALGRVTSTSQWDLHSCGLSCIKYLYICIPVWAYIKLLVINSEVNPNYNFRVPGFKIGIWDRFTCVTKMPSLDNSYQDLHEFSSNNIPWFCGAKDYRLWNSVKTKSAPNVSRLWWSVIYQFSQGVIFSQNAAKLPLTHKLLLNLEIVTLDSDRCVFCCIRNE